MSHRCVHKYFAYFSQILTRIFPYYSEILTEIVGKKNEQSCSKKSRKRIIILVGFCKNIRPVGCMQSIFGTHLVRRPITGRCTMSTPILYDTPKIHQKQQLKSDQLFHWVISPTRTYLSTGFQHLQNPIQYFISKLLKTEHSCISSTQKNLEKACVQTDSDMCLLFWANYLYVCLQGNTKMSKYGMIQLY